jgi:hypothetical protein
MLDGTFYYYSSSTLSSSGWMVCMMGLRDVGCFHCDDWALVSRLYPYTLVDHITLVRVIHKMITTEDTSDITRSFFSVALVYQVVTCASDAPRFEMAINLGVIISLMVCIEISLLCWGDSNFILHCCICHSGQLSVLQKNMESGSLVLYRLIFQTFVTKCPSSSISVLISSGLIE